jgi:hypothetical protein
VLHTELSSLFAPLRFVSVNRETVCVCACVCARVCVRFRFASVNLVTVGSTLPMLQAHGYLLQDQSLHARKIMLAVVVTVRRHPPSICLGRAFGRGC